VNNIFINRTKRKIALILLGFFVFSFLHSELGFLDYDGDNHGAHDYCQIVKNTVTHSKILSTNLPRLEKNRVICFNFFEEITAQVVQTSFFVTDHHLKEKPSSELFLVNSAFLI
jgi:hypothetical protein